MTDNDDTMVEVDNHLSHYGIKGMKWGVRKRRGGGGSSSAEPTDVIIKSRPGKIETSGGHNQPPSDDAKRAAAYRQKARASSVHSLSNAELKALVERMNLEANYAKALANNRPPKGPVQKFIDNFIEQEKNTLMKGQKPKTAQFVETIINVQKGRKARTATKAAANVAGKALEGRIVNR